MSASLVGSEMCIRDSGSTLTGGGHKVALEAFAFERLEKLGVLCVVTVSYTHLTLPTICSV
eukprot:8325226-Alexandrium_andersonii.AAC.1